MSDSKQQGEQPEVQRMSDLVDYWQARAETREAELDQLREANARLSAREEEQRFVARKERDRADQLREERDEAVKEREEVWAINQDLASDAELLAAKRQAALAREALGEIASYGDYVEKMADGIPSIIVTEPNGRELVEIARKALAALTPEPPEGET